MKHLPLVAIVVVAVLLSSAIADAQSLGALATADATRRAAAQPAKVYTNADLVPEPHPPTAAVVATAAAYLTSPPPLPVVLRPSQTEAYWKDRSRALQLDLEIAIGRVRGASSHLSGLQEFSYWSGSGLLMAAVVADNRFETTATLNQYLAAMQSAQVAIATLDEEARRAGVPPGWLRLP